MMMRKDWEELAIEKLREYLRIKSVQPQPEYSASVEFLLRLGRELVPLSQSTSFEVASGYPVVSITIPGTDPTLPSLLLNSHMDVVPVTKEKWTRDPWGAELIEGKIYGRGSQDMKSVGMATFMAVAQLVQDQPFRRTIILLFVPDEEVGGKNGMALLVKTLQFKEMRVGYVLDEGFPSPHHQIMLFNGERAPWWVRVRAIGNAGHGSAMLQGTAIERLYRFLTLVYAFRDDQIKKLAKFLHDEVYWRGGSLTSINVTMLEAGKQINVHPDEANVYLDIRVAKDLGEEGVTNLLNNWTAANHGLSWEFVEKSSLIADLPADPTDLLFAAVTECLTNRNIKYEIGTFPGATDSRYLRALEIPAIGISPFRHTPVLAHDHDEYLGVESYLEGIKIYKDIIKAFCL